MNQALFGCAGGTGQVEGGPKVHLRQSSAAKSSHPAPKSQTYMCAQNTSYTPIQRHYTYTSSLILSNHTFTGHNKVQHNTTETQTRQKNTTR